tara:strand:+ start:6958 stop:7398 length:441 start_codon:yes stop_codon:yes gene_type:complete
MERKRTLSKYLLPYEVCEELDRLKTQKEKILFIQQYQSFALRTIVQLNFNDKIKLDLPDGKPPYRVEQCPQSALHAATKNAFKGIGRLAVGSNLPTLKKESMFIRMLETLNAKDAEMLWRAKDGKLEELYPKLTRKLVEKIWPTIL